VLTVPSWASLAAELTEIADKTVKWSWSARPASRRPHRRRPAARHQRLVDRRPPGRLPDPDQAVRDAVVRQNADPAGGNVTRGLNEQSLRTMGRVADPKSFNDLVWRRSTAVPVACATSGGRGRHQGAAFGRAAGRRATVSSRCAASRAITRSRSRGRKANLEKLAARLPADVPSTSFGSVGYIYQALHEIKLHLVLGSSWPRWSCSRSCGRGARHHRRYRHPASVIAGSP